jgi:hypothetical protein
VRVTKDGSGWRGEFTDPPRDPIVFAMQPGTIDPAPELEALDREFAAKSAELGGDAWPPYFADDGAEWSDGKRIERAELGATMRRVLLGATLAWTPRVSGKLADLGFTIGDYQLASKASGATEHGSYCTIWRRQADAGWKIVFDIGSHTK